MTNVLHISYTYFSETLGTSGVFKKCFKTNFTTWFDGWIKRNQIRMSTPEGDRIDFSVEIADGVEIDEATKNTDFQITFQAEGSEDFYALIKNLHTDMNSSLSHQKEMFFLQFDGRTLRMMVTFKAGEEEIALYFY